MKLLENEFVPCREFIDHEIRQQDINVLYTARTQTAGGRNGTAYSDDGHLAVRLSMPGSGPGTNPEQLFAAAWSACLLSSIELMARQMDLDLSSDSSIGAEIDLCSARGTLFLQARLNVSLPGIDRENARGLVDAAHQICPYSKATRGNVDVVINLI
jgi:lipoyl-dependent peroxiredoxin